MTAAYETVAKPKRHLPPSKPLQAKVSKTPKGAKLRKVGKAVVSNDLDTKKRWKLLAALRLQHLKLLGIVRFSRGDRHPRPENLLILVTNAIRVRYGEVTADRLRIYIHDNEAITDEEIETWARRPAPKTIHLIGNEDAGELANLDLSELLAIQDLYNKVLTMHPTDESDWDREDRREARSREKAAKRQQKLRDKLKVEASKSHDLHAKVANQNVTVPITELERDAPATFGLGEVVKEGRGCREGSVGKEVRGSQRSQVIEAIGNGAATISQIIAVTGLPKQTIKSWLTRLVKAGDITRTAHGRYGVLKATATAIAAPEVRPQPPQTLHLESPLFHPVTGIPFVGRTVTDQPKPKRQPINRKTRPDLPWDVMPLDFGLQPA
jgi:hypothetical protein